MTLEFFIFKRVGDPGLWSLFGLLAGQRPKEKAHFAAVMGNSLTRNCREQGWSVDDALRDDDTMTAAMRTYAIDEDPLYSAMAEHVRC